MAYKRQSRPDSGFGFQVKVLGRFRLFPLCSEAGFYLRLGLGVGVITSLKGLRRQDLYWKSSRWTRCGIEYIRWRDQIINRCRANMAHIRQSRPDSGIGFQVKSLFFPICSLFARKRPRSCECEDLMRGVGKWAASMPKGNH